MNKKLILGIGAIVIVALGVVGGAVFSKMHGKVAGSAVINTKTVNSATEVGSMDTQTFGDTATGKLDQGGLGVDGTHHLTRDGGPSQTVYLISSVVDLDQYVGKTVQVWGQTIKAQKAPWLMDVGRLKIVQ